jgi:hypothetical protein
MHLQAVVPQIGEVKQIHIHKGPSDKSLFLHTAPSVKSTNASPPLFHQVDDTKKYQFSNYNSYIYLHLCVPLLKFSVRCSSQMQFCMTYLQTWGSTQPYVAFWTLDFRPLFFVFGGTHVSPNSLTLHKPVSDFSDGDTSVCTAWLSHVIARTGSGLNCWVDDRHKHEPKLQTSHK